MGFGGPDTILQHCYWNTLFLCDPTPDMRPTLTVIDMQLQPGLAAARLHEHKQLYSSHGKHFLQTFLITAGAWS